MKTVVVESEGGKVLFETDLTIEVPGSMIPETARPSFGMRPDQVPIGIVEDVQRQFEDIEGVIVQCAKSVDRLVNHIAPDEISVEFGVTLGGEAGIPLVTKGTASANFKISIKWKDLKQKPAVKRRTFISEIANS